MSVRNHVIGFAVPLLLCAAILGTAKPALAADTAAAPAPQGTATCMMCHANAITEPDRTYKAASEIYHNPMGVKGDSRTPMAQQGCESCHGPSEAHVMSSPPEGKKTSPAIVFTGPNASPVAKRNEVCIGCHQDATRMNWAGSKHQNNSVACVSCHTLHVAKDPVLVKATQAEKCFTCHAQQRAESFQYSRHPMREGKVACSDCHNPHGSIGPKLLKEATVNDTCYGCHAEKRGPMLWEHLPVRENCMNCHTPHGSNEPRLMKERAEFMCSSCHSATSNHSGGAFGGANALPGHLQGTASFNSALGNDRTCLNCHSQVHGSNSPNGSMFFR